MCLVLFARDQHPDYPLVLAANRDEYHERPTAPLGLWGDVPLLAGRDLRAGGTWLGADGAGRVAAVTNVRGGPGVGPRSRGNLTRNFLSGASAAEDYARQACADRLLYGGFNLLIGTSQELWYVGCETARALPAGLFGLANAGLDVPWPKVTRGKRALRTWLQECGSVDDLLGILADSHRPADVELPGSDLPIEVERQLAPIFIRGELYGTRASSVVLRTRRGDTLFRERRFGPNGEDAGESGYIWRAGAARPEPDAALRGL